MLSLKQLQDYCLLYNTNSRKCRYLAQDDDDASKYYCLKLSSKRSDIDDETADHFKESKNKGIDPYSQGNPLGDNCSGYPILKHIDQGHDCP